MWILPANAMLTTVSYNSNNILGAAYLETKYTSDESEEEFKEQDDEDIEESEEDVVPPKIQSTKKSRRRRVWSNDMQYVL